MNASIIADYADIAAAIGVIASLLFVAFQVRQNTKAMHNQAYASIVERFVENVSRLSGERMAVTLDKGKRNFNDLSDPEKLTFGAWAQEYISVFNRNLSLSGQDLLAPQFEAMAQRQLKWFFKYPGMGQWWRDADRHPLPAHFEAIIDAALVEMGPPTA